MNEHGNKTTARISLGPILFFWSRQSIFDFYSELIDADFDIIYLGETVCNKRRALGLEDWLDLANAFHNAGKQVVLSTLSLLESESDLSTVKRICQQSDYLIEANDYSSVNFASKMKLPFVGGAFLNLYNQDAINYLAQQGMYRWLKPLEMSANDLYALLGNRNEDRHIECASEVFVYGHMPLAMSARCFTARAHGKTKDDCDHICMSHPNGLSLATQEQELLFTLNGIQTMSGKRLNLLPFCASMLERGVDVLRISPEEEMNKQWFSELRHSLTDSSAASQSDFAVRLQHQASQCHGYWDGKAGIGF